MAPAASSNSTVCVMDASGPLGSSLVRRLLQNGYTVHAAVQTHDVYNAFYGHPSENSKLKIFLCDPLDYQSIVEALKGCCGLFYTFEPPQDQPTYDEHMAEMEVRAAHNVLEACAQTNTVGKVVFTSSATAIIWSDLNTSSSDIDERHWSDINFCRKLKLWHALSKTLAERAAWALARDRGVNMVCVNAGLTMLPDLSVTAPYLRGAAEMYEDGTFVAVDLDYLVDAHICVFQNASTYGRYLCFNRVINRTEDATRLATLLTLPLPQSQSLEQDTRIIQQRLSGKKLNKLMADFEGGPQVD